MSLRDYAKKRDFTHTSEPPPSKVAKGSSALRFVIQKHAASRLHYDFRLEWEGVLKSWAVPKGIPYAKGEKHLAVQVEDHPLEYASFEGTIPKGEYGGGTVMLWDEGTYEALDATPGAVGEGLARGKLHFILRGTKLQGEWALVRMNGQEADQWLLFKADSSVKPPKDPDRSVRTHRRMEEIAAGQGAVWKSNHGKSRIGFIEPMKAKLAVKPSHGDRFYELKFDGYRALSVKDREEVTIYSRNAREFNDRFPEVVQAVARLEAQTLIVDGEIVALDAKGRPRFRLLQGNGPGAARSNAPVVYYLFDLLHLDGADLCERPIQERRRRLEELMAKLPADEPVLRFSSDLGTDPGVIMKQIRALELEGIVGKRFGSRYEAGRRSGAWIKLKSVGEQEFVIGGYTDPQGTRSRFGALLLGYFAKGKLQYAGKTGTGFTEATLAAVHAKLANLGAEKSPFALRIEPRISRKAHWVRPELVCQVKFTEWTGDGRLRHPVFVGLREDKSASDVGRE